MQLGAEVAIQFAEEGVECSSSLTDWWRKSSDSREDIVAWREEHRSRVSTKRTHNVGEAPTARRKTDSPELSPQKDSRRGLDRES